MSYQIHHCSPHRKRASQGRLRPFFLHSVPVAVDPFVPICSLGLLCSLSFGFRSRFFSVIIFPRVRQNDTPLPLPIPNACAFNTQSSRHLSFVARRRLNDFLIAVSTTTLPLHRFAKIKPPLFMLYNSNERAVVRTLLYYVPERSAFLSYSSFISPPAFRSLLHTLHYSIQGFAELVLLVLSPSHDPTLRYISP